MRLAMATLPIPVRIPVAILPRLDAAAARLGTTRSALIAFCARTFLDHFEREGEAVMPPDWPAIMRALDGRTTTARQADLSLWLSPKIAARPSEKTVALNESAAQYGEDTQVRPRKFQPRAARSTAPLEKAQLKAK